VEVLAIKYDQLNEVLSASEITLESLHQAADKHEEENIQFRSREDPVGPSARQA
jgi:hypothetical protein